MINNKKTIFCRLLKNSKGTDKILSIYWLAILFIVAAGIVYMVVVFYGEPYDVREIEATLLANKISDCVSDGGYLKSNIFSLDNAYFFRECSINFEVEDFKGWNLDQFYVETEIYDFDDTKNNFQGDLLKKFSQGNVALKDFCSEKGKNFPKCVNRKFYAIDESNNQHIIGVLSIVRKTEKNVR